jgi:outer membrane protein TolC
MIKRIFYLGLFLGISQMALAQDTLSISLTDVVQKITAQNLQIKVAQQSYRAALADYQSANSLFLPSITVSHTAISTTNPLMAFGSRLNQKRITMADFNPVLLNNPDRVENFATKLEVLQPLINLDGVYERKAAMAKRNAYLLESERTKDYVLFEAEKAFLQLNMAYKAVKAVEEALKTAQENGNLIQNYYNQGLVQKTDVLLVEVRISELKDQLAEAKSMVFNASDYLAFLLDEDALNTIYKPSAIENTTFSISENRSYSFSNNRKDFEAIDYSVTAYKEMYHAANLNFLPRLNAFGSYEMYDTQLFQIGARGYLVGAQLSWDIFDGYKSIGQKQKAKAEFLKAESESKMYKSKSLLEFNQVNRQLSDLEQQSQTALKSWKQSEEVLRIRKNRFEQGLEKATDLLAAETQVVFKNLAYLQTVMEYNTTKAYLGFLTR